MKRLYPSILLLLLVTRIAESQQNPPTPSDHSLKESIQRQQISIEVQRRALSQQLNGQSNIHFPASNFFVGVNSPLQEPSCAPTAVTDLESVIQDAARKQSISAALIKAVIKQESGFRPCAVSPQGAQGLMQLMPATAHELQVVDPFDPDENIEAGAAYLKQMLDRYKGDLRLALIAYNAGPGRADQSRTVAGTSIPFPLETQDYVAGVLAELAVNQPEGKPADLDDGFAVATEVSSASAPVKPQSSALPARPILPPKLIPAKSRMH